MSETLEGCLACARREFTDVRAAAAGLVKRHPAVYWDVNAESVRGDQHAAFLIERMLEDGTMKGIEDLLFVFPRRQIAEVVARSRRISRKTALFWKNYLEIKDPIRCLEEASQNLLSRPWTG